MSKRNEAGGSGGGQSTSNKKYKTKQYNKSKDRYGTKTVFEVKPNMPGILLFCDRNKERKCINEANVLFHEFAAELYPETELVKSDEESEGENEDIEDAINKELNELNSKEEKKKYLFGSMKTQIDCIAFMLTKDPVEPYSFVYKLFERVEKTGITNTKFISRMIPVQNTCYANLNDITSMAKAIFKPYFHKLDQETGKIEPKTFGIVYKSRFRNDLARDDVISTLATVVGKPHKVELSNPDLTIVVEIFKSICAIGVLKDYQRFKKYNIQLVASASREKSDSTKDIVKEEDEAKGGIELTNSYKNTAKSDIPLDEVELKKKNEQVQNENQDGIENKQASLARADVPIENENVSQDN